MSTIIYPEACGGFFASEFPAQEPGTTIIHFERQTDGFVVVPPPGVDWADYEAQPDLEIAQPDDEDGNPVAPLLVPQEPIRHPREPWLYYQQELGVQRSQPAWEEADAWTPTRVPDSQNPLTDVDISTANFATAEEMAAKFLNSLKGKVVVYLKSKMSDDEAVAAGVEFVDPVSGIGSEYAYFVTAGGHPLAAAKLYSKIQSVKKNFAWFDDQADAIFTAALTK